MACSSISNLILKQIRTLYRNNFNIEIYAPVYQSVANYIKVVWLQKSISFHGHANFFLSVTLLSLFNTGIT